MIRRIPFNEFDHAAPRGDDVIAHRGLKQVGIAIAA
jgi:hypothetical protein